MHDCALTKNLSHLTIFAWFGRNLFSLDLSIWANHTIFETSFPIWPLMDPAPAVAIEAAEAPAGVVEPVDAPSALPAVKPFGNIWFSMMLRTSPIYPKMT